MNSNFKGCNILIVGGLNINFNFFFLYTTTEVFFSDVCMHHFNMINTNILKFHMKCLFGILVHVVPYVQHVITR